jgi:putative holliday junction resolvase
VEREAASPNRYNNGVSSAKHTLQGSTAASAKTILSVDYGRARIGLAIATAEARLPRPLTTLERINRNEDMRRLRELVREHDVKQIIVGLPLLLDGTRGEMAEEAHRFAERARKQIGVPVEMVDERLTSWEAERLLEEEFGKKYHDESEKKKKLSNEKPTVDSVAAAVILREYLARQTTPGHI